MARMRPGKKGGVPPKNDYDRTCDVGLCTRKKGHTGKHSGFRYRGPADNKGRMKPGSKRAG